MKIMLADYGGYPFTFQLAGSLTERGHDVLYAYRDPSRLRDVANPRHEAGEAAQAVRTVWLDRQGNMEKGNLLVRWMQERGFGLRLANHLGSERPDVVLSTNMPLDAQSTVTAKARHLGIPIVYWLQDLIGTATSTILSERLGVAGRLVGAYYLALENRLLRRSDKIIAISESFRNGLARRGVRHSRFVVHPNWSPIDEIPVLPKANPWSHAHGWDRRPVVLYSGSLGMKHDPGLLEELARSLRSTGDAEVVVVAEGAGATWLAKRARSGKPKNLHVLPFQDRAVLPQVLATGDVLIAMLESAAGTFSVPSKVLSYLCAGRPIVAAVPDTNDVARLLEQTGAGIASTPGDSSALSTAVKHLLYDDTRREAMGSAARRFAEEAFDIDTITARFESYLYEVVNTNQGLR